MKKQVLIGVAIFSLLLCLTSAPASAQSSGKCVAWYWDWNEDGSFAGPLYTWVDNNGTFINAYGEFGTWYEYKGERAFIMDPSEYDGFWVSKKIGAGAMIQYNIIPIGYGVWYSKGTNKKNCETLLTGIQETQGRSTAARPK